LNGKSVNPPVSVVSPNAEYARVSVTFWSSSVSAKVEPWASKWYWLSTPPRFWLMMLP
jgi:hypothetical protein